MAHGQLLLLWPMIAFTFLHKFCRMAVYMLLVANMALVDLQQKCITRLQMRGRLPLHLQVHRFYLIVILKYSRMEQYWRLFSRELPGATTFMMRLQILQRLPAFVLAATMKQPG